MSAGWEVGDLALRVKGNCGNHQKVAKSRTVVGSAYRVIGVRHGPFPNCRAIGLVLFEDHPHGLCSDGFRKIRPDQHEDCEPEFVTLLQRVKRPAKQGETA